MINKSFLRILVCNALAFSQDNKFATIAENRVYDTELDDVDARDDGTELSPRIFIYTDNSDIGFQSKNPNSFASYATVKLRIELIVFGGYQLFGHQFNNNNKFLQIMSDLFEQQVFEALFKAQNQHAQKFRDFIVFASDLKINNVLDNDSDKKILVKSLEVDVQLPEQYSNSVYSQDRQNILDSYPDYVNLIPTSIKAELDKIFVISDSTNLENITTEMPIVTVTNEYPHD